MNRDQLNHFRKIMKEGRRKLLGMAPRFTYAIADRQVPASARFTGIALRSSYQRRRGR